MYASSLHHQCVHCIHSYIYRLTVLLGNFDLYMHVTGSGKTTISASKLKSFWQYVKVTLFHYPETPST